MPRRTAHEDLPRSLDTVAQSIIACERCPRLRTYCARIGEEKRAAYRDDTYWARPVPGFGDPAARVWVALGNDQAGKAHHTQLYS